MARMTATTEAHALTALQQLLLGETGLGFDAGQQELLRRRLRMRAEALQLDGIAAYAAYLRSQLQQGNRNEFEQLISLLTVNESAFFRNPAQFHFLREQVLPCYANHAGCGILSAGCANGEEIYSIAMLLAETKALYPGTHFQLTGCDIDHQALNQAAAGRYPANSFRLRNLSRQQRKRFFSTDGHYCELAPRLRTRVTFRHCNLLQDRFPENYDIICCSNVLLYFPPHVREQVIIRLHRALNPSGWLFLGATEVIDNPACGFTRVSYSGGTAWQKAGSDRSRRLANSGTAPRPGTAAAPLAPAAHGTFIDAAEDHESYQSFLQHVNDILAQPTAEPVLDLSRIVFISRAGLNRLAVAADWLNRKNSRLTLIINNPAIRKSAQRSGLDKKVRIIASSGKATAVNG